MHDFHRPEDEKRMVVILGEADYGEWLDERNAEPYALLRQFDPNDMTVSS